MGRPKVIRLIKEYLLDMNESNEKLKANWNEGYIHGLSYGKIIDEQEFDHLMEWIKSNPIIEQSSNETVYNK